MGNGFLDDLPDLGIRPAKARKKLRQKQQEPAVTHHKIVIWHKIKCPECDSHRVPVHTTRKPIRYHKCLDCGCLFKSVEG